MEEGTNTACLLLPNIPADSFCGIDLLSFTTSPRFHGIKHVPPGWHVVFTGANNTFSLRHGAWFYVRGKDEEKRGRGGTDVVSPPQLFVKNWDPKKEELVPESDAASVLRWRANLGSIWRESLTPYRQTVIQGMSNEVGEVVGEGKDWGRLTDCISASLLTRIIGATRDEDHWGLTSASSAKEDIDTFPGLSGEESAMRSETVLGFLAVDLKKTWREGAVGRERTQAAQDRSWALGSVIQRYCDSEDDVIGELQFTFLMVLTLNNTSCLEQWKRLLGLILTCQEAVEQRPDFFVKILSTLRLQLEHCQDAEGGLFDLSDQGGNLLKSLLNTFSKGLDRVEGEGKEDVMDELHDLEEYLKTEHGWLMNDPHVRRGMLQLEDGERVEMDMNGADEEDESGDYAPVIVDLTPEQSLLFSRRDCTALMPNGITKHESHPEDDEDEDEEDFQNLDRWMRGIES